jgi:hypothetical protein
VVSKRVMIFSFVDVCNIILLFRIYFLSSFLDCFCFVRYSFNDSSVHETTPDKAITPMAYVLFYKRRWVSTQSLCYSIYFSLCYSMYFSLCYSIYFSKTFNIIVLCIIIYITLSLYIIVLVADVC